MKSIILIFLIGILMTTSFAIIPKYDVEYDKTITIDGTDTDWNADTAYLYDGFTATSSWYEIAYSTTGTVLPRYFICGYFSIRDSTVDTEYDRFIFVYNTVDSDNHLSFSRDGKVYDGGSSLIDPDKYPFTYKKIEYATGWGGEFCFTYEYNGFTNFHPGTAKQFTPVSFKYFNYGGGLNQKTVYGNIGTLNSEDYWQIPIEICSSNDDCLDNEQCIAAATGDICLPVNEQSECGYVADHQWNEYQCCDDSACAGGKICDNHICELENPCNTNSDCADTEFCAPLAIGDVCLALNCEVYETIVNHECALKQGACYDNSDCAVDHYCSNNFCFPKPSCTKDSDCINYFYFCVNQDYCEQYTCSDDSDCPANGYCDQYAKLCHNLEYGECSDDSDCGNDQTCNLNTNTCVYVPPVCDYECCSDNDCNVNEYCSGHQCVDNPPDLECYGDVKIDIEYALNQGVIAQISGLHNCEGKLGLIKKDNCNGMTMCMMELSNTGGSCSFSIPVQNEWHTYAACVDMDDDDYYSNDEKATEMIYMNSTCDEPECTPMQWSACVCTGTSTTGVTVGSCTNGCGILLEYTNECQCPPTVINNTQQGNQTLNQTNQGNNSQNQNNTTIVRPGEEPQPDYVTYALVALGLLFLIVIIVGSMKLLKGPSEPTSKTPITKSKEKLINSEEIDLEELDKKPKK
ncbi:MAG: hypothetical protein ABID61_02500 [Candidatus Micrarchaeota archaeon]